MQVPYAFAQHIFPGKKAGLKKEVFERCKKFAVEVGDVVEKMDKHMPKRFFWLYVFLATNLAKPAHDLGATVKAVFLLTFGGVRQVDFSLKIKNLC